jgi:hypothetical protein
MLAYGGSPPGFDQAYFGSIKLRDAAGEMLGVQNMRAIPVPYGMRVFALTRDFEGAEVWTSPVDGWTQPGPPIRYGERLSLGRPCWVRAFHCKRVMNDQLPSSP